MHMDKFDPLKLDNQLCFPLYVAAKETIKLYRPLLDELNLTYTQYLAMMCFWEHRQLSVKELGEKLYLDSGTLTPVLKSLEAKGFVRRRQSMSDERVLLVEVTDDGQALRECALPIPGIMAGHIVLSPEDTQTLYRLLRELLKGIEH